MGFLQHFYLVIKCKKGNTYKLVSMLSSPPTSNITSLETLMHMEPFTHDAYIEVYIKNEEFEEVFDSLQGQSQVHNNNETIE